MSTTRRLLLAFALTLVLAPRGLAQEAPAGRWVFEMPRPGVVEFKADSLTTPPGPALWSWELSVDRTTVTFPGAGTFPPHPPTERISFLRSPSARGGSRQEAASWSPAYPQLRWSAGTRIR